MIIDSNGLCYRARYTLSSLTHEEQKVGVVFGFLRQLFTLSKKFETNRFIFAWDSRKSLRRRIYPEYKLNRRDGTRTPDDERLNKVAFKQFNDLRLQVLPGLGFKNNFIQTGMEADDLIASIVQNYNGEFVIVSADHDFYQLLSDHTKIYSLKKLLTKKTFVKQYGIQPKDWAMVRQIAGCKTDNVAGVPSIGEKRAIAYLTKKIKPNSKFFCRIEEKHDIIERNEALVKLPFAGTRVPELTDHETFRRVDFIRMTNKYGFVSFQKDLDAWVERFHMV